MHVSNSELGTFCDCRRRWWLGYYRALTPATGDDPVGAAPLGTLVHLFLGALYSRPPQDPWLALEARVARDKETFPLREEEIEKQAELARIMCRGYLDWLEETGADDGLEVIGSEQRIEVPSGVPGVELLGKLDLRVRRLQDEARLFLDHKTVGDFTTPVSMIQIDRQMLMYALLELLTLQPGEPRTDGGIYNMLKKSKRTDRAKPPFYHRVEIHHNMDELRTFWHEVHGVIRDLVAVRAALDAGADHHSVCYPRPTRDCRWKCSFYAVCPLFNDGSHAEGLLEASYVTHDPYERYDSVFTSEMEDE